MRSRGKLSYERAMAICFRYAGWIVSRYLRDGRAREEGLDHLLVSALSRAADSINLAHGQTLSIRTSFEGHGEHESGVEIFDIACIVLSGGACAHNKLLLLQSKKIRQHNVKAAHSSPFARVLPRRLEDIVARVYWKTRPRFKQYPLGTREQLLTILRFNRRIWPVHYLFYGPPQVRPHNLGVRVGQAKGHVLNALRPVRRLGNSLSRNDVAQFPSIHKWIISVLGCKDGATLDVASARVSLAAKARLMRTHTQDGVDQPYYDEHPPFSSRFFIVAGPSELLPNDTEQDGS